ncbi:hypothetical protein [uncultured Methylobacterium sp.]|uniref:hypothetical protein n=1 Tax=uncultured Methylobacterium sp. TaxID=157278 RepID=UPI0035CA7481
MSAILDRILTRLYRAAGAALFLALCGFVSYTAGSRHHGTRSAELPTPAVPRSGDTVQNQIGCSGRAAARR